MLCVEIKGNDLQNKNVEMCLTRCRHLILAAAGFRQTGMRFENELESKTEQRGKR